MTIRDAVTALLSIPKTVFFNFKVFNVATAVKMPIVLSYKTKIEKTPKNSIIIRGAVRPGMIKIGLSRGSAGVMPGIGKSFISVKKGARIIFNGTANFSEGISIRVDAGELQFGNNMKSNKSAFISCSCGITFGNDVLLGWCVNIRDTDGHTVIFNNARQAIGRPVRIGDHVWMAAHTDVLKGTTIGNDCIVGYRACVAGGTFKDNTLIAGVPAKVIKENVTWE